MPYEICGIEVRLMTADDLLALIKSGSPLVCGGAWGPADVAAFLWFMSTDYKPRAEGMDEFLERVCLLTSEPQLFDNLCCDVQEYLDFMFLDSPGSGEQSNVCFVARIVDSLAFEYHWSPDVIRALPIPQVIQYERAAGLRHKSPAAVCNRLSDRAMRVWLDELNKVPVEHRDRWNKEAS